MEISITKRDLMWSYVAQFFTLASGLITLPLILNKLSPEEVGLNYILLMIGSMISLFDFGLSSQFGRNLTYVLSGAQQFNRDGLEVVKGKTVNNHLVAVVIETAKFVYKRLSLISLVIMLTFGTLYVYLITHGFRDVPNSLGIWLLFSLSVYFNLYYLYYSALLNGTAQVMESKRALFYSKIAYVVLCYLFLLAGWGLLGVVLSNLIAPFICRFYSYKFFYTKEMKNRIKDQSVTKEEKKEVFKVFWYNAKKLGVNFIGAYCITQSGMFLAGMFLTFQEVGSYGLMVQIFGVLAALASVFFNTYLPKLNSLSVLQDGPNLVRIFAFTMVIYYMIVLSGGCFIVLAGPRVLEWIGSESVLPGTLVLLLYFLNLFFDGNHTNFMNVIVASNRVPFVVPSLITGFFILLLNFIFLKFTNLGILGIVLSSLICQSCYNHWKWPKQVLDSYQVNVFKFVRLGIKECLACTAKLFNKCSNQNG